jgi:hypothetical protein
MGISCQSRMREEVEKPFDPVGVAFRFALGDFSGDSGGSSRIRDSSCRMGCAEGGGSIAGLVWSRDDAEGNPDVDVASPSSASFGRFKVGFDDRFP